MSAVSVVSRANFEGLAIVTNGRPAIRFSRPQRRQRSWCHQAMCVRPPSRKGGWRFSNPSSVYFREVSVWMVSPRVNGMLLPATLTACGIHAAEVHLYGGVSRVPADRVFEAVDRECSLQLAIDSPEEVQIELARHALGVVVGCEMSGDALLEIDANDCFSGPSIGRFRKNDDSSL